MTASNHSTVYVLETPDLPGIVKIGFTSRSVPARLLEINQSAFFKSHKPFRVLFSCRMKNAFSTEQMTHKILSRHRLPGSGELFNVDQQTAINAIYTAAGIAEPERHKTKKQNRFKATYRGRNKFQKLTKNDERAEQVAREIREGVFIRSNGDRADSILSHADLKKITPSKKSQTAIMDCLEYMGVVDKQGDRRPALITPAYRPSIAA